MIKGIEILGKAFKFLIILAIILIIAFIIAITAFAKGKEQNKFIVGKIIQYYPETKIYPIYSDIPINIKPENLMFTRMEMIFPEANAKEKTSIIYYIK